MSEMNILMSQYISHFYEPRSDLITFRFLWETNLDVNGYHGFMFQGFLFHDVHQSVDFIKVERFNVTFSMILHAGRKGFLLSIFHRVPCTKVYVPKPCQTWFRKSVGDQHCTKSFWGPVHDTSLRRGHTHVVLTFLYALFTQCIDIVSVGLG